jgi:hypothetical protein
LGARTKAALGNFGNFGNIGRFGNLSFAGGILRCDRRRRLATMAQATADQIVARLLATLPPLELLRIAEMPEAARLAGLSVDTLAREHPDKVVKLSKRRNGMRVAHALMLRETDAATEQVG